MIATDTALAALSLATLTCWLCRPMVAPSGKYRTDDSETEHSIRLLGRQVRLTLLALALTIATLVALLTLPQEVNPDLRDLRRAAASCGEQESPYDPPTCYAMHAGGQWVVEEIRTDGTRGVIATVTRPTLKAGGDG